MRRPGRKRHGAGPGETVKQSGWYVTEQHILDELLTLLAVHGITVRGEPLEGNPGGLCKVRGKTILFLDTGATAYRQALLCAEAAAKLIDIEAVYLRPEVRRFIADRAASGTGGH